MNKLLLSLLLFALPAFGQPLPQFLLASPTSAGGCTTYATWDPTHQGGGVLSNGNLTFTTGASGYSVLSTTGKSTDKWYWEITVNSETGGGVMTGIGLITMGLSSYPGADANGWAYWGNNGNKFNNGSGVAYGSSYPAGTVIGVYLDAGAGTVGFLRNNIDQGQAFSGLSGTIYAATGNTNATNITANFGATAFTYSPPSGYTAGLCN